MNDLFKQALTSSANPENLSLTVRGILVGFVPLLIGLANLKGVEFNLEIYNMIVDEAVNATVLITTMASIFMVLVGIVRKIWIAIQALLPQK